jgi:hypothetical protein
MSELYKYSIATNTPNGAFHAPKFAKAIEEAGLPDFEYATGSNALGDVINISFKEKLNDADKDALDALLAAHDGELSFIYTFLASSTLFSEERAVTESGNWQVLGFVVCSPAFFVTADDVEFLVSRSVFDVKAGGGEMRIVESGADGTEVVVGIFAVPDTGGLWLSLGFETTVELRPTRNSYRMEARRSGALDFELRGASISLMKKKRG